MIAKLSNPPARRKRRVGFVARLPPWFDQAFAGIRNVEIPQDG